MPVQQRDRAFRARIQAAGARFGASVSWVILGYILRPLR